MIRILSEVKLTTKRRKKNYLVQKKNSRTKKFILKGLIVLKWDENFFNLNNK